ncbi:conserved hypothetical protein [Ricinus communis]|uniref:Uncharacterized protein n=1 Tax=Ricinus communis TaxID=3988 RepID=B9S0Z1_RICCO|nr:conserved hypothetical protein [Ricinus communis]
MHAADAQHSRHTVDVFSADPAVDAGSKKKNNTVNQSRPSSKKTHAADLAARRRTARTSRPSSKRKNNLFSKT